MRRIKITHEDYKFLDTVFNADSARNAPAGFLVHNVIEENKKLKKDIMWLESLLAQVDVGAQTNARDRNAAFDRLDAAVAELKIS